MRKIRKINYLMILVVIILLIFFSKGHTFLDNILNPLQNYFYNLGVNVTSFKNYKNIINENKFLREEIDKLSIDYIKLSTLQSENKYLREELGFLNRENFEYKIVDVIGRETFNDKILIINQGSNSGLEIGQPVIINQGIIIGKLIEVKEERAYVELLTNNKSRLAVTLDHLNGTNGMLVGGVGNGLLMDLIPQDKEVKIDDVVITSGLEEKVPRGLYIGQISQIESLVGQVFKKARVEQLIDYQGFSILTVIK